MKTGIISFVLVVFVAFAALLFAGCLGGNDNGNAEPTIPALPSIPAIPTIEIPSIPSFEIPTAYPATGVVGVGETADSGIAQLKVTGVRYVEYFYDDSEGIVIGPNNELRYHRPSEGTAFTVVNFTLKNIQEYPLSINTLSCPVFVGYNVHNADSLTGAWNANQNKRFTKGYGDVTELNNGESVDAEVVFDIPLNATEEVLLDCWDALVRIA